MSHSHHSYPWSRHPPLQLMLQWIGRIETEIGEIRKKASKGVGAENKNEIKHLLAEIEAACKIINGIIDNM